LGVRGPKSKIEEQRFVEGVMENRRPKMARFRRETKKKKQFEVCDRQTDKQAESIVENNRLGAEINSHIVQMRVFEEGGKEVSK